MSKIKLQIKNRFTGSVIFEYESENNTISETVKEFIRQEVEVNKKSSADLSSADLRFANLSSADLRFADLSSADLRSANLSSADLRSADLRFADLRSADLSSADLSSANLRFANLRSADLRSADLRSANLRSADLSSANLDKRYISISCIGSSKRMTTYCFEDNKIWCGCFTGTLEEFELKVNDTHKNNAQYLKEYLGFINYLKSIK
jgi:uncharacterized protein YjbI with pentapeptide repeats